MGDQGPQLGTRGQNLSNLVQHLGPNGSNLCQGQSLGAQMPNVVTKGRYLGNQGPHLDNQGPFLGNQGPHLLGNKGQT